MTYGTTAATYLAVKTLHQLTEDESGNFPKAFQTNFYVDDLMTSSDMVEEVLDIQNQLTELLQRGMGK